MLGNASRKLEAARFLRFCGVGAVGFLADTGTLLGVVHVFSLNPILAKMLSFAVAGLLTFELNRRWAFGVVRHDSIGTALITYLGVQSTGFACNLAVFTASFYTLPAPFNNILLCSVLAAGAALLINYVGARRLVFGTKPLLQAK